MECSKKDFCANFNRKCVECGAMSDIHSHHPCFADKVEHREKLTKLLASKGELLKNLNVSIFNLFRLAEQLVEDGVRVE